MNDRIKYLLPKLLYEKDKTQDWLAKQVGVKPATVSRWVSGHFKPYKHNIEKIAEVLNIKATQFREYRIMLHGEFELIDDEFEKNCDENYLKNKEGEKKKIESKKISEEIS